MAKERKSGHPRSSISILGSDKKNHPPTSHPTSERGASPQISFSDSGSTDFQSTRKTKTKNTTHEKRGESARSRSRKGKNRRNNFYTQNDDTKRSDVLKFRDIGEDEDGTDSEATAQHYHSDMEDGDTQDSGLAWESEDSDDSARVMQNRMDASPEPLNVLYYTFFKLCKLYHLSSGCGHLREIFGSWTDDKGLDQMDVYPEIEVLDLSSAYIGVQNLMILADMLRSERIDKYHFPPCVSSFYQASPNLPDNFFVSRLPELKVIRLPHMCLDFNVDERQRLRLRPDDWSLLPSIVIFSPSGRKRAGEKHSSLFPLSSKTSGNAAIRYFLSAITGHPSLQEVDLHGNPIGPALLPAICRFIKGTPSIRRVHLHHTGLSPDELERVKASCELNRLRQAKQFSSPSSTLEEERRVWRAVQVDWLRKWCESVWKDHQEEMVQTSKSGAGGRGRRVSSRAYRGEVRAGAGRAPFSCLAMLSAKHEHEVDARSVLKSHLSPSLPPIFTSETPYITTVPPPPQVVCSMECFFKRLAKRPEASIHVLEGAEGGGWGRGKKGRGWLGSGRRRSSARQRSISLGSGKLSRGSGEGEKLDDSQSLQLPSRPSTRAWRQGSFSSVCLFPSTVQSVEGGKSPRNGVERSHYASSALRTSPSTFIQHEIRYSHVFNTPFLRYIKCADKGSGSTPAPLPRTCLPFSGRSSSYISSGTYTASSSSSSSSSSSFTLPPDVEELMKTAFVDPRIAELTFLQGRKPCRTLPTCKAFGGVKGVGTARWIDGTISTMNPSVAQALKKDISGSLLMRAIRRILFPPPPSPPPSKLKAMKDCSGETTNTFWRTSEEQKYYAILELQEKQWNLLLGKLVSLMKPCRFQIGDAIYRENEEPYWLWFLPSEFVVDEVDHPQRGQAEEEGREEVKEGGREVPALVLPHEASHVIQGEKVLAGATRADTGWAKSQALPLPLSSGALEPSSLLREKKRGEEKMNGSGGRENEEDEMEEVVVELHTNVPCYPTRGGRIRKKKQKQHTKRITNEMATETFRKEGGDKDGWKAEEDLQMVEEEEDEREDEVDEDTPGPPILGGEGGKNPKKSPSSHHKLRIPRGQFFGERELFGTTSLYMHYRQKRIQEEERQCRQQRYVASRSASPNGVKEHQQKGLQKCDQLTSDVESSRPSSSTSATTTTTTTTTPTTTTKRTTGGGRGGGGYSADGMRAEGRAAGEKTHQQAMKGEKELSLSAEGGRAAASSDTPQSLDLGALREQYKYREGDAVLLCMPREQHAMKASRITRRRSHSPTSEREDSPSLQAPISFPLDSVFPSHPSSCSTSAAVDGEKRGGMNIPIKGDAAQYGPNMMAGRGGKQTELSASDKPENEMLTTTRRKEGSGNEPSNEMASSSSPALSNPSSSSILLWQLPLEVAFFYLFDPYQRFHQKAAGVLQTIPGTQDIHPSVASMVGYVLQPFGVTITEVQKLYGKSRVLSHHDELMSETIILYEGDFVLSVTSSITGKKTEKLLQGTSEGLVITNNNAYQLDDEYRSALRLSGARDNTSGRFPLDTRGAKHTKEILGKAAALQQYREQKAFAKRQQQQEQEQHNVSSPNISSFSAKGVSSPHGRGALVEHEREYDEEGGESRNIRSCGGFSTISSPRFSLNGVSQRDVVKYKLVFGTQASHWRYYRIHNDDWAMLPPSIRVALSRGCMVLGQ